MNLRSYLYAAGVVLGTAGAAAVLARTNSDYRGSIDYDAAMRQFLVTTPDDVVCIPADHRSLTPQLRSLLYEGVRQGDGNNTVTLDGSGDVRAVRLE